MSEKKRDNILGVCDPLSLVPRILCCKDQTEFSDVISGEWDPWDDSNEEKRAFMFTAYHEMGHFWDFLLGTATGLLQVELARQSVGFTFRCVGQRGTRPMS